MSKLKKPVYVIFGLLTAIILIQNAIPNKSGNSTIFGSIEFEFLVWKQDVPVVILILIAAMLGYMFSSFKHFVKGRNHAKSATKLEKTKEEIDNKDE